MNILKEMLLIEEPSIFRLYKEMSSIASYFISPVFTIALIIEYFGELDFGGVVKKLLIITVFMGAFYQFHTTATEIALDNASYTLKKVSPRNLFVKKWYKTKVRTTEKRDWNFIQSIIIPNLNDLLGTAFFLLAKVFIWLLKLIYSSVYHLTYVFSGVTAILYFLGWTKDALKGTVQASLWCMIMPFVIVAILALVGNSIDESALGSELIVTKVDTIIWLFGVTLLLLISPLISYGMIKGDGIHSFGSKMGAMVVSSGIKSMALLPLISKMKDRFSRNSSFINRKGNPLQLTSRGSNKNSNSLRMTEKEGKESVKEVNQVEGNKRTEGTNNSQTQKQSEPIQQGKETTRESKPRANFKPAQDLVKQKKLNFQFDDKYWDSKNSLKGAPMKRKHSTEDNSVNPHKAQGPVNTEKRSLSIPMSANGKIVLTRPQAKTHGILPMKKEKRNELR